MRGKEREGGKEGGGSEGRGATDSREAKGGYEDGVEVANVLSTSSNV